MLKKGLLLFFFFITCCSIPAQTTVSGARGAALGFASTGLTDPFSASQNIAALGFVKQLQLGTLYDNRFFLKELSTKKAILLLPCSPINIGVAVQQYGYSLLNETAYSFLLAKAFSPSFSAGMGTQYIRLYNADAHTVQHAFIPDIGVQTKIKSNLMVGVHLRNPLFFKFLTTSAPLPAILRMGCCYNFSSLLSLVFETEKETAKAPAFKGGIEYQPLPHFFLRAGACNQPVLTTFGLGFQLQQFKIDLSGNYHQTLGTSSQINLIYIFCKTKTDRATQ